MNTYLKIFLAMGIPYGIAIGVLFSFPFGIPIGLVAGVAVCIFFGGFFSLTLGLLHTWSVKRMSYGISEEAMGVHHVRNVELRLPYDKAYDLCIESISLIKKCRIKNEDRSQGKIEAKAGMTWKTWGDVISFDVRKIDIDKIQVEASSRPAVRMTLVDYGKNLDNVETLIEYLKTQRRRHCMNCRYDLRGTDHDVCPECGTVVKQG